MFLQFMLFAVWWVPLAAYLTNLGVSDTQKVLILSSMAIGCIASPVIGGFADRYFSGERTLAGLNFITSLLLLLAGFQSDPDILFILLLMAMLAYMPSWGLTSAIAMTHSPAEEFPEFDGSRIPLFCGSGLAFIAAMTNLGLPSTPPLGMGKEVSIAEVFGLKTLTLMKDKNFAIFIVSSFFAFILVVPFSVSAGHWL